MYKYIYIYWSHELQVKTITVRTDILHFTFPGEFSDFYLVLTRSKMLSKTAKYQQRCPHVI